MNEYEQKQEARKEYYKGKAEQARQEYEQAHDKADSIAGMIPQGQPILVGHHSEKRHRRDLDRIDSSMRKALDAAEKAKHYEQKAQSVGKGGISSDDPEAVKKLKAKLEKLEADQEYMKLINKIHTEYLKSPTDETLDTYNLTENEKVKIKNYKPAYSWEPHPFAPFALKNNNANIRSIKKRIEKLQAQAERETKEHNINGIEVIENAEANRLQIFFPDIPSKEIRDELKSSGFRWAPSNGCWQAYLNNRSIWQAKRILERM